MLQILNILKVSPDEKGISGNYYDAGTIIDEIVDATNTSEFIGLFIEANVTL